jgi:hypothetical protein
MKIAALYLSLFLTVVLGIKVAYWWSNIPPRRPSDVSTAGVFLWAGHLGLPAAKHGTWIECWTPPNATANRCRLTEMDGRRSFEGDFVSDTSRVAISQAGLQIDSEKTAQRTDLWVLVGGKPAPLVFLRSGEVLVPREALEEGHAKLMNDHD